MQRRHLHIEMPKAGSTCQYPAAGKPKRNHTLLQILKSEMALEPTAPISIHDDKNVDTMRGGRKSSSRAETSINAEATAALLGVKVMGAPDMPGFMQAHAFRCARRSYDGLLLDKFSSRQLAHDIKKEFDKMYGPTWHCIVGMGFGSFVTHSRGCFIYFSMEKIIVMLFKTGVRVKDS